MKVFMIFIIAFPSLSLQEHRHDHDSGELDLSRQEYDYDHSPYYRAASRKHRHKKHSSKSKSSVEMEVSNDKFAARQDRRSHKHSSHSKRFPGRNGKYFDDCVCDCLRCDELLRCCQSVCNNECDDTDQNQVDVQPGLSPGNLVFVPYPYPLVVPPPPLPVLPVLKTVTTSTAPSIAKKDHLLELLQHMKYRRESPYNRDQLAMRPVNRNIPDYEMPTSDDHLLDSLLSQVRNVKDINSG